MRIDEIYLKNFRVYGGENILDLRVSADGNKNLSIISGQNGYGKSSLLTALIWCLYGKMMVDVEESYRQAINDYGGYQKFLNLLIYNQLDEKDDQEVGVRISFSEVIIPGVPISNLVIERSYSREKGKEDLKVLIDGVENELSMEIGPELFINDYLLPREIAKFFFFDAERIVSLAEIKTQAEKRSLSYAYSDILGISKYEILRNNLRNVRDNLRRRSTDVSLKSKLQMLQEKKGRLEGLFEDKKIRLEEISNEINTNKTKSNHYQEKLIREGQSISLAELNRLKDLKQTLNTKQQELKSRLIELMELVPFVIAGNLTSKVYKQSIHENKQKTSNFNNALFKKKLASLTDQINREQESLKLEPDSLNKINEMISITFSDLLESENSETKVLLGFSEQEKHEFESIYRNISSSFKAVFEQIVSEEKNNRIIYNRTVKRIDSAEAGDEDAITRTYRDEKKKIDIRIKELENEKAKLLESLGGLQNEIASNGKVISEMLKKVRLDDNDLQKDAVAKRLLDELAVFIQEFKKEKVSLFELRIRDALINLMHKKKFVYDVSVNVKKDIIDINLIDRENNPISKESLSKGEQQLFASAILKALVGESGKRFPVFIDSPLQKFDKTHSDNIIQSFYPNISNQVVIFPLLEKELSKSEYALLSKNVDKTFIIKNSNNGSTFELVEPDSLFVN